MKNYILFLLSFSAFLNYAQNLSVNYVDEINFPDNPKNNSSFGWRLDVTNGISLYAPIEEIKDEEKPVTVVIEGETFETVSLVHNNYTIYYFDQSNNTQILQMRNKGKDYLVKEPLQKFKWTILDESKQIDNYKCRAAKTIDANGYEIKAWFAPEIPVSLGPGRYIGLPGLILEVKIGFKHYLAKRIQFSLDSEINPPSTGRIMTREEYDIHNGNIVPKNSRETVVKQEGSTTITTTTVREVKVTKAPKKQ